MSILEPPPPPPTKLAIYRQLSPLAGVHVSPLCLGAMSIGDKWDKFGMGAMNKETSFQLLDAFYAAGGNFIDTANNYQDETSEQFIGEWMEARGIRDQMVIATKVCPDLWFYVGRGAETIRVHSTLRTTSVDRMTSRKRRTTRATTSRRCTSRLKIR